MKMQENKFTSGQILMLEEGEYSDYGVMDIVLVLKDFDMNNVVAELRAEHKPKHEWDSPEPSDIPAFLVVKGLVSPLGYTSIHCGSYGRLEI